MEGQEGFPTITSLEQANCAQKCKMLLESTPSSFPKKQREALFGDTQGGSDEDDNRIRLLKQRHSQYLLKGLERLPQSLTALDASRPWLFYWMLHGLDLLGTLETMGRHGPQELQELLQRGVDTMARCLMERPVGGFAGGPQQLPHTAPTFAATMALCIIGGYQSEFDFPLTAYSLLEKARPFIYSHSFAVKEHKTGAFRVHARGLLNLVTPELSENAAEYLASCQTYEGGVGGEEFNEAHGGYTFCAFAAICILGKENMINKRTLLWWLMSKQMNIEGGFQGRTNKLVDGCYSWWQGASAVILEKLLGKSIGNVSLLNRKQLQKYLLKCCQQYEGGMRDKPGVNRDYYHTCYCLSGLSLCQHDADGNARERADILGPTENLLEATDTIYNIRPKHVAAAKKHFDCLECNHSTFMRASGMDTINLCDTLTGSKDSCVPINVLR